MEKYEDSIWVSLKKDSKNNKRGDPWSQACMKIEMRLRCYFGHLVIGNL